MVLVKARSIKSQGLKFPCIIAIARKLYLNTEKFFNNAMLLCIEKFLLLYLLILLQIKCLYRV